MRAARASVIVAVLFSAGTGVATAQVCNGTVNFDRAPMRVTAAAQFADNGTAFSGGLLVGSRGPYGGASIGTVHYDALDASALALGLSAGYQAALDPAASLGLCLSGSFSYTSGPNNIQGTGIDASSTGIGVGMSLGGIAYASSGVKVVPAVSISALRSTSKLKDRSGYSESSSDTYGMLAFTIGFSIANDVFTFGPAVYIPLGLEQGKTTFGVALEVALGHRSTQTKGR
jgi:hypothetical protein